MIRLRKPILHEFIPDKTKGKPGKIIATNWGFSALAGTLQTMQFFFYGLGHVKMGSFQFASWVLHMSMLIFFSYIVGMVMKEWKNVRRKTYVILILGLITLTVSFCLTSYGSYLGDQLLKNMK